MTADAKMGGTSSGWTSRWNVKLFCNSDMNEQWCYAWSPNSQTEKTRSRKYSELTSQETTRSQAVATRLPTVLPHSTFGDHVTLLVTRPCDTPYVISYWRSFGTECLSPAVFEILRCKRIGDTNLTFQCHATPSSVTWPFGFDSLCHFLLELVLWNQASISNGFRDIQRQM